MLPQPRGRSYEGSQDNSRADSFGKINHLQLRLLTTEKWQHFSQTLLLLNSVNSLISFVWVKFTRGTTNAKPSVCKWAEEMELAWEHFRLTTGGDLIGDSIKNYLNGGHKKESLESRQVECLVKIGVHFPVLFLSIFLSFHFQFDVLSQPTKKQFGKVSA